MDDRLPEIRIADVDRDAMSSRLRIAFGEGRITEAEFADRLGIVAAAKTRGELELVATDLPVTPGDAIVESVQPAMARERRANPLTPAMAPFVIAPVTTTVIYLLTTPGKYFWPAWVFLGCGTMIALMYFGKNDSTD